MPVYNRTHVPDWVDVTTGLNLREPKLHIMFNKLEDPDYSSSLDVCCSCDCKAKLQMHYFGFNQFLPSGQDNDFDIIPEYQKKLSNLECPNIYVKILNFGVLETLTTFIKKTKAAAEFKRDVVQGIRFELRFDSFSIGEVGIIVRQDTSIGRWVMVLSRVGTSVVNFPLEEIASRFEDCIGIIHSKTTTDDIYSVSPHDFRNSEGMKKAREWVKELIKLNGGGDEDPSEARITLFEKPE